ncbi:MAG: hypothetical protein LBT80_02675 [Lactobacillaceae bacterium]|jgi:hypothetical protein|nr:hypothetical protein [Lactobacillaceae bacterium]
MAKWKHALMVGTIVAPIAFGAGTNLVNAAANYSASLLTDVAIHKYVQTTDGGTNFASDKGSYYWGNGNVADAGIFTSANGYESAKAGEYGFTAFTLADSVISGFSTEATEKDKPKISTANSGINLGAGELKWNEIFEAVKGAATNNVSAASDKKSSWTIQVKSGINAKALAVAFQAGSFTASAEKFTDASGDVEFTDLPNGNYVILETTSGDNISIDGVAKPMVLHLPMQNPTGTVADATAWFGGTTTLNLYPKNYAKTGDLTVVKYDSDDANKTEKLKNVKFGLLQIADEATETKINEALAAKNGAKSNYEHLVDAVTKANGDIDKLPSWIGDVVDVSDYDTAEEAILAAFIAVYNDSQAGTDDDIDASKITLVDVKSTGSNGLQAHFTNLMPGASYYVLEVTYPEQLIAGQSAYLKNGELHKVTLNSVDVSDAHAAAQDLNANDGIVDYWGGKLEVLNDDTNIDKTINNDGTFTSPNGTTSPIENNVKFKDADTTTGITRGQDFQYGISADMNQPGKLTKYEIVDSVPYQVDIKDMTIGLAIDTDKDGKFGEEGEYLPLVKASFSNDYNGGMRAGEAAEALTVSYTVIESSADAYASVFGTATPAEVLSVSGVTSAYTVAESGAATKVSDGSLKLAFNEVGLDAIQRFLENENVTDAHVNLTLTAVTNSGAQSEIIDNKADLTIENHFDKITDNDNTPTFDAGWDIVKHDQDGNALAGAGFVLSHEIETANVAAIKENTLSSANSSNVAVTDANLVTIYDKLKADEANLTHTLAVATTDVEKAAAAADWLDADKDAIVAGGVVYFTHLDGDLQPVLDLMDGHHEMGAIFWTTAKALATTHVSDENGYLQFCGLAAGKYTLIETIAPSGYTKLENDVKFSLLSTTATDAEKAAATAAGFPIYNGKTSDPIIGDATDQIEVKNYKKSIFPVTGAAGLVVMILAGLTVMAAAMMKRKKDMAK